jgi:CDP-glucose 4,6-dehydratase
MHLNLNFKKLNEFQDFNFGPKPKLNITVEKLISDLANNLDLELKVPYEISDEIPFDEAKLLKLNCEKAAIKLDWEAVLEYSETVDFTGQWYSNFIKDPSLLLQITKDQIINYVKIAKSRNISWTRN